MDKFFEHMDERFKTIESELDYNYTKDSWQSAENILDDAFLDSSFVEAAESSAIAPVINFDSIDDAFLDDAFIEASAASNAAYSSQFFNEFKSHEDNLIQNDSFVSASNASKASYQSEYWNEADIALQNEGLHHEYKAQYWAEAEKLLARDKRKGFFWLWGSVATLLLLLSGIGLNLTPSNLSHHTVLKNNTHSVINPAIEQTQSQNNTTINELISKSNNTDRKTEELNEIGSNLKKSTTTAESKSIAPHTPLTNNLSPTQTNVMASHSSPITPELITCEDPEERDLLLTKQNPELIEDQNSELTTTTKLKPQKTNLIALNRIVNTPQLIEFTPIPIRPKHLIGLKLEKGIGNVFTENKTTFSGRDALYIDYRFVPEKKLRQFEFGFETGIYHMNLDNLEFEQNYSVHRTHGEVDHYWSKMTYENLLYISSSINVFYNLNAKHKIKVSAGLDQLLTSKIDMKYKTDIETAMESNNGEWGINKGINALDFKFGMGYEYDINTKFSFLFDTKFGTLDKTNNDYLRNTKMNRDISLLIGLKYSIFAIR